MLPTIFCPRTTPRETCAGCLLLRTPTLCVISSWRLPRLTSLLRRGSSPVCVPATLKHVYFVLCAADPVQANVLGPSSVVFPHACSPKRRSLLWDPEYSQRRCRKEASIYAVSSHAPTTKRLIARTLRKETSSRYLQWSTSPLTVSRWQELPTVMGTLSQTTIALYMYPAGDILRSYTLADTATGSSSRTAI